jgi:hypothetical protein
MPVLSALRFSGRARITVRIAPDRSTLSIAPLSL